MAAATPGTRVHTPDGFINAGTSIAAAGLSAGAVAVSLRRLRTAEIDAALPVAGITAAFIFAAQMVNFPVAAGTTGHLIGGALAAILLGPTLGLVALTVVISVQAVVFADGGISALGINVFNTAVVTSIGGYVAFTALRRVLPANRTGVLAATALASWFSVVLASLAFSVEWLFGANAPIPFDDVFTAMVAVHALIGIGEGVISALVVATVLTARPDLVFAARDVDVADLRTQTRLPRRAVAIAAIAATFVVATIASQFAASSPDGLERVAIDEGFAQTAEETPLDAAIFADYATRGVTNPAWSLAIAGASGAVLTLILGWGLLRAATMPVGSRVGERERAPSV